MKQLPQNKLKEFISNDDLVVPNENIVLQVNTKACFFVSFRDLDFFMFQY